MLAADLHDTPAGRARSACGGHFVHEDLAQDARGRVAI
jgi:hypothetical protein